MKKNLFFALAMLLAGAGAADAASFSRDTKRYALSSISFGYFEHYHRGEKDREGAVSIPVAAYGRMRMDLFTKFSDHDHDFGASFPIIANDWLVLEPLVFHNFEADEIGCGVAFQLDLRGILPWRK